MRAVALVVFAIVVLSGCVASPERCESFGDSLALKGLGNCEFTPAERRRVREHRRAYREHRQRQLLERIAENTR